MMHPTDRLHYAIRCGDVHLAEAALVAGADVNGLGQNNGPRALLATALSFKTDDMMLFLLQSGADPNSAGVMAAACYACDCTYGTKEHAVRRLATLLTAGGSLASVEYFPCTVSDDCIEMLLSHYGVTTALPSPLAACPRLMAEFAKRKAQHGTVSASA